MILKKLSEPVSPPGAHPGRGNPPPSSLLLDGPRKQALETAGARLIVTGAVFILAFVLVGLRLADLAIFDAVKGERTRTIAYPSPESISPGIERADIVDRHGAQLATSLVFYALYAHPHKVLEPAEAAEKLAGVFGDSLNARERRALERSYFEKLTSDAPFVWLRRNLTPEEKFIVNNLGLAGIDFKTTQRRVYFHTPHSGHIVGLTNVDGKGLAGVERFFDARLRESTEPLRLSVDMRIQSILHDELTKAKEKFSAKGAAGIILDANTSEVISLVSLPGFDPNRPQDFPLSARFNRVTMGVYEMGSTFKLFTAAMAFDSGKIDIRKKYDVRKPLRQSGFTIRDFHPIKRKLTLPEIIVHSSNIGSAQVSAELGTKLQKHYLQRFGLLDPVGVELPEVGRPLTPSYWKTLATMTVSYGHGIAVTPLQLATGIAALVNGGQWHQPTLIKRDPNEPLVGTQVITRQTSATMRKLMRQVVRSGTGRNAGVTGYRVGGKTGTAEKYFNGAYQEDRLVSSFVAAFPMNRPKFVILVLLDEPVGTKETGGFATGGAVAAPVAGKVIKRVALQLGLQPRPGPESVPRPGDPLFIRAKLER